MVPGNELTTLPHTPYPFPIFYLLTSAPFGVSSQTPRSTRPSS